MLPRVPEKVTRGHLSKYSQHSMLRSILRMYCRSSSLLNFCPSLPQGLVLSLLSNYGVDGRTDGWMDRWMVGWMDGRMDGQMDGWTDGRIDGQTECSDVESQ